MNFWIIKFLKTIFEYIKNKFIELFLKNNNFMNLF